tara:strand:- start:43 stop:849 length:807 start_codon:yes stop_codon:yes gene_type:complete
MAFNEVLGNTLWRTTSCDRKIISLLAGSDTDKIDQILDLLRTNRKYYLQNGSTADAWTDRVLHFAWQRAMTVEGDYPERYILVEDGTDKIILENDDLFIMQNEPIASIDYMNAKDLEWFNSDVRCDIGVKLLMTAVNAKWHSFYHGDSPLTELSPDGNIMGPSDDVISNLSWLPSKILDFHNKIMGLSYSKYVYFTKLNNIHTKYSAPEKTFTEIEAENAIAVSSLNTDELIDLLAYVRETYTSRPDDKNIEDFEAACEMLEFDMAQQ